MAIHNILDNLSLVDLDQPLEGFRNFIGCWIYQVEGTVILVDPGPRSTVPVLLNALKTKGVGKIDYILLTHVHVDHAGGAGLLLSDFPEAKVICHPHGIRHMVDPKKLWENSKKVLGHVAETYGEIAAIPERNIGYQDFIPAGKTNICVLQTPGHAPHHLSFKIGPILFAGEVAGVHYPLQEGLYLRLVTPPVFEYEIFKASLEKVSTLNISHICFGHYGHRCEVKEVFETALHQLDNWLAIVEKHLRQGSEPFEEKVFANLLENDRGLSYYTALPADIQSREKYFSMNSIKGMREYITGCIFQH
jgi:glyoxylase-like metal-dependent hydrolase (beta-lactamase superfamily II)